MQETIRKAENRWRRRRRGYYYLVMAALLFGLFLILAGTSSRDWTWVFAVLGFASLILCMRKGLPLWDVRGSVLGSLPVRQSKRKKTLRREARTDLATP